MTRRGWSRDELLLAFNLYCKTPFGRLHRNNPDIVALADHLHRTPSAVAMKLVNFASIDPTHQQRNVRGLRNASQSDQAIFEEFSSDWEHLAFESEMASERIGVSGVGPSVGHNLSSSVAIPRQPGGHIETEEFALPSGATETQQLVRVRLVQRFFRQAVVGSYGYRCAMCQLSIPDLLNASHIIPWSADVARRADPTNGLALCSLHDRAFDRGLLAVDADLRIAVSPRLLTESPSEVHEVALIRIAGKPLDLPNRFSPDRLALAHHRENVFS